MSDHFRKLIGKSTLGPIPKPYKCRVCGETTLAHHTYQLDAQLCEKHYREMKEAEEEAQEGPSQPRRDEEGSKE